MANRKTNDTPSGSEPGTQASAQASQPRNNLVKRVIHGFKGILARGEELMKGQASYTPEVPPVSKKGKQRLRLSPNDRELFCALGIIFEAPLRSKITRTLKLKLPKLPDLLDIDDENNSSWQAEMYKALRAANGDRTCNGTITATIPRRKRPASQSSQASEKKYKSAEVCYSDSDGPDVENVTEPSPKKSEPTRQEVKPVNPKGSPKKPKRTSSAKPPRNEVRPTKPEASEESKPSRKKPKAAKSVEASLEVRPTEPEASGESKPSRKKPKAAEPVEDEEGETSLEDIRAYTDTVRQFLLNKIWKKHETLVVSQGGPTLRQLKKLIHARNECASNIRVALDTCVTHPEQQGRRKLKSCSVVKDPTDGRDVYVCIEKEREVLDRILNYHGLWSDGLEKAEKDATRSPESTDILSGPLGDSIEASWGDLTVLYGTIHRHARLIPASQHMIQSFHTSLRIKARWYDISEKVEMLNESNGCAPKERMEALKEVAQHKISLVEKGESGPILPGVNEETDEEETRLLKNCLRCIDKILAGILVGKTEDVHRDLLQIHYDSLRKIAPDLSETPFFPPGERKKTLRTGGYSFKGRTPDGVFSAQEAAEFFVLATICDPMQVRTATEEDEATAGLTCNKDIASRVRVAEKYRVFYEGHGLEGVLSIESEEEKSKIFDRLERMRSLIDGSATDPTDDEKMILENNEKRRLELRSRYQKLSEKINWYGWAIYYKSGCNFVTMTEKIEESPNREYFEKRIKGFNLMDADLDDEGVRNLLIEGKEVFYAHFTQKQRIRKIKDVTREESGSNLVSDIEDPFITFSTSLAVKRNVSDEDEDEDEDKGESVGDKVVIDFGDSMSLRAFDFAPVILKLFDESRKGLSLKPDDETEPSWKHLVPDVEESCGCVGRLYYWTLKRHTDNGGIGCHFHTLWTLYGKEDDNGQISEGFRATDILSVIDYSIQDPFLSDEKVLVLPLSLQHSKSRNWHTVYVTPGSACVQEYAFLRLFEKLPDNPDCLPKISESALLVLMHIVETMLQETRKQNVLFPSTPKLACDPSELEYRNQWKCVLELIADRLSYLDREKRPSRSLKLNDPRMTSFPVLSRALANFVHYSSDMDLVRYEVESEDGEDRVTRKILRGIFTRRADTPLDPRRTQFIYRAKFEEDSLSTIHAFNLAQPLRNSRSSAKWYMTRLEALEEEIREVLTGDSPVDLKDAKLHRMITTVASLFQVAASLFYETTNSSFEIEVFFRLFVIRLFEVTYGYIPGFLRDISVWPVVRCKRTMKSEKITLKRVGSSQINGEFFEGRYDQGEFAVEQRVEYINNAAVLKCSDGDELRKAFEEFKAIPLGKTKGEDYTRFTSRLYGICELSLDISAHATVPCKPLEGNFLQVDELYSLKIEKAATKGAFASPIRPACGPVRDAVFTSCEQEEDEQEDAEIQKEKEVEQDEAIGIRIWKHEKQLYDPNTTPETLEHLLEVELPQEFRDDKEFNPLLVLLSGNEAEAEEDEDNEYIPHDQDEEQEESEPVEEEVHNFRDNGLSDDEKSLPEVLPGVAARCAATEEARAASESSVAFATTPPAARSDVLRAAMNHALESSAAFASATPAARADFLRAADEFVTHRVNADGEA